MRLMRHTIIKRLSLFVGILLGLAVLFYAEQTALLLVLYSLFTICSTVLYFTDEEYPMGHWWRLRHIIGPVVLAALYFVAKNRDLVSDFFSSIWHALMW